ncbi:MAG: NADH-quinone oxidoreductase subunit E [Bacteroidales bacterium]|jgi:formate hydrogenlyase subunit 3/multisubunit Na+/H+ antiporter MnhD subunit|nr:NADH-quinone oxidoreductase subunit E [Bacteroidales bacterium]
MTGSLLFFGILLLSLLVFLIPKPYKYVFTLVLLSTAVILTSAWAVDAYTSEAGLFSAKLPPLSKGIAISADRLSAFFIVVVNITVLTGFLFSRGYLKPWYDRKSAIQFSIHYLSYLWLYFSMIMVVMIRDGVSFLIMWEIMALTSFLLVIFDAEDRNIMKTGISYLIQMHAGMFFILAAFLIVYKATGEMSFDALGRYFREHGNISLFLLFFAGFGIKAGFIPLHTWLPEAHPAAPSHVSGVMSGVMIKMGIYGIIRVLLNLQDDLMAAGIFILAISLLSGLLGVMMAIVQHDLKRLLAYHSIENIGIIGIGLGVGTIGLASGNGTLYLLGFSGAILHVLNHSLFKSLLFFSAGSVYTVTHTRNMEHLGGLSAKMPWTTSFFLVGSLAICGLPPFNGFISEFLIYIGLFKGLASADLHQSIILISSIVGLSLIGGLAVFCFTKAFGISFLGIPRTSSAGNASEVSRGMILPQLIPVALIILIGMVSVLFIRPVMSILSSSAVQMPVPEQVSPLLRDLTMISITGGIFVLLIAVLLVYRHLHLERRKVTVGPTWGCGYTAGTHRQQYTATSFAYNYNHLAKPVIQTSKHMDDIPEEELFPGKRSFHTKSDDPFKKYLVDIPVEWLSSALKKLAVMQTGKIQHYILYAFVFILVIMILTFFNII